MLVGNKCDDNSKREVNAKTGEALQVSLETVRRRRVKKFVGYLFCIKRPNHATSVISCKVNNQGFL